MKIWHRANLAPKYEALLKSHRLTYKKGFSALAPTGITYLLIDASESDPSWEELGSLVRETETFVWTEFTLDEIVAAEWLTARASFSIGYAVPENKTWSDRYFARRCRECGTGWDQVALFRIKAEPRLKGNDFASFAGAFELFSTQQVVEDLKVTAIAGFEVWPLLLDRSAEPSALLQQLRVLTVAAPSIDESSAEKQYFRKQVCSSCGQVWFTYYIRGMLPMKRASLRRGIDLQLTHEWFGNGRTARREILVSQRIVKMFIERGWKGLDLAPVRLV